MTVAETRLPGMSDFALVDASHTWILDHPRTGELVVQFLEHGRFANAADSAPDFLVEGDVSSR